MGIDGEVEVCRQGLVNAIYYKADALADVFRQRLKMLTAVSLPLPRRTRPKLMFGVDAFGWCGERLSRDLMKHLYDDYDSEVFFRGDSAHLKFDADLYIYRNPSWLSFIPLPKEVLNRTITLVESVRVFTHDGFTANLPKFLGVIPLNKDLGGRAKALGCTNVWDPIGNGVNTDEFTPVSTFPKEFTVGCAGNFAAAYYDDWKGFSKYIVPACKLAGVRLEFRSWKGKTQTPGLKTTQSPMGDMAGFYKGLSCFVLMSRGEGCSGVTFEAMASGLPVISTKVGWHGEQRGSGIIWVKRSELETPASVKRDIKALAKQILRVKSMSLEERKKLGAKGRAMAVKNSWGTLGERWREAVKYYLTKSKV